MKVNALSVICVLMILNSSSLFSEPKKVVLGLPLSPRRSREKLCPVARNNRIVEKTLVIASERALALKEWALGEGQSPHNIKLRLPFIVGLRRGGKFETGTSMTLSQLLWFAEKQFPLELVCLRSVMGDASETLEYEYFISDCMSKGIFPRGSTDDFTPVRTKLKTNTWTVLATE